MDWNLGQQPKIQDIQQPDKYETDSDNESNERRWLWSSLWQDMHDQFGKISTRSSLVRVDLWGWCNIDGYTTWI